MKLKVLQNTWLKQSTDAAANLKDSDKSYLPKDFESPLIKVSDVLYAGHHKISFPDELNGYQTWLVYADHVEITGQPMPKEFFLDVPYFSQRDNKEQWWRTCNSSSCAMAAEFLKPGCIQGSDDIYFHRYVKPRGDTTYHQVQTDALKALGIDSAFHTSLDFEDLDQQLSKNKPIPISVLHKGTIDQPSGGHIIVVIGKYPGGYICHDPWGEGFSYVNHNGKAVKYPIKSLQARWLDQGPNTGWGRIFR